jgi:hypothetical protein
MRYSIQDSTFKYAINVYQPFALISLRKVPNLNVFPLNILHSWIEAFWYFGYICHELQKAVNPLFQPLSPSLFLCRLFNNAVDQRYYCYLFTAYLTNEAVSNSNFKSTAPNNMIKERIVKNLKGSGCGLLWGTIPAIAWGHWERARKTSVRIAGP